MKSSGKASHLLKRFLLAAGMLLGLAALPQRAAAQAVREDDSVFANAVGFAKVVPQAQIRLCAQPATFNGKGQCTNFVTVFTDTTGVVACNGTNGCSQMPINADANGNYHYYVPTGTYTLQRMFSNGTLINTIVDHNVGASGGGGGGGGTTTPTAPVSGLQFNLDATHFGGASSLLYHPAVSCVGSVTGTCDTLTTAVSPVNPLQLNFQSPDLTNNFLVSMNNATVANGGHQYSNRNNGATWTNNYSFATFTQHTVAGATASKPGYGLVALVSDLSSDASSGQNMIAGYFGVGLTKANGVANVAAVKIASPFTNAAARTGTSMAETASTNYGIDIDDQRSFASTQTAMVHMNPATLCATCYSVLQEDGGGSNQNPWKIAGAIQHRLGTALTIDTLPMTSSFLFNNVAQAFTGWRISVQNLASVVGSTALQVCGGVTGTTCMKFYADGGTISVPIALGTTNASVAGGLVLTQGPNSTPLANSIIHQAPAAVQASGLVITEQGVVPNGIVQRYKTSGVAAIESTSGDVDHSVDTGTKTAAVASTQLCALAVPVGLASGSST
jgi:hypothetical protein